MWLYIAHQSPQLNISGVIQDHEQMYKIVEIACIVYCECLENSLLVVLLQLTVSTTFTRSRHKVMEQFRASTLYLVDSRILDDLYQISSLSLKLVAFNIQFTIDFNKFEYALIIINKIQNF